MNTLDQILYLTDLGLRIHPLSARNKIPLLDDWTRQASKDERVIKRWFKKFPNSNWGIATGFESGVFVIDIDPKHKGKETWEGFIDGKASPKTLEVVTGTKGTHYYFEYPSNIAVSNSALGKGVDVRGEGGNIVIPPSIHPNGNAYMWAKGRAPDKIKITKAPKWLLTKIKEASVLEFPSLMGTKIEKGERNNTIFHQSLLLARQGALFDFTLAAMKSWVKETREFDMSDKEVEATVESAFKFFDTEKVKKKSFDTIELSDVGNVKRLLFDSKEIARYAVGLGFHVWDEQRWAYDEEALKVKQLAISSMDKLRDETLEELKRQG